MFVGRVLFFFHMPDSVLVGLSRCYSVKYNIFKFRRQNRHFHGLGNHMQSLRPADATIKYEIPGNAYAKQKLCCPQWSPGKIVFMYITVHLFAFSVCSSYAMLQLFLQKAWTKTVFCFHKKDQGNGPCFLKCIYIPFCIAEQQGQVARKEELF